MIVLEKCIVWGPDVVMLQEPVFEKEGYNISPRGYRLSRGGTTMTVIEKDTHLEFSEVDKGGDGYVQVLEVLAMVPGYPPAVQVWNRTGWFSLGCYPEDRGTLRVWGRVRTGPRFHLPVPTTLARIKYLNSDRVAT